MKASLPIVVRSTEIDVNGHVNNAKYLEYFEWAREAWYEQCGLPYETFGNMGIQTVTVNINVNYRQECRQGDLLTVTCQPADIGRSSYVLRQEIVDEHGNVRADALVTSVTMDASTRKSREAPDELRRFFGEEN
ncbi:acyl-CoA thioesterase [Paenibacillus lycopersici]|uniref:Acyl-CoA thioesterase n=1 Tax=Paenibacillus lycopersici TaxID=2704462 RepID=A0A6C0G3S3_9BACL|nr:acyl-CoA thioesterase [Paenibacillus lycopersici]QHT62693.1 acyl-CoA thioesterase [Paenibacillus lycopersici]